MKVFDLHIGLSDAVTQLKKDPKKLGDFNDGEFPNQFDFIRAKKGKLDTFCGMICPIDITDFQLANDQVKEVKKHIDVFLNEENENLKIIRKLSDFNKQDLKVIIGIEGIYFLNNIDDLQKLNEFIDLGVKIIGPKWNFENNLFNKNKKITKLGLEFLKLCEKRNIVIDLAHSEGDYIDTILENFNGKVMDSHTCMYSLNPIKRNIKDSSIKEICKRDGLVGINFISEFIGGSEIKDVLNHIEYFIKSFGIENLAIGSDFDGMDKTDLIKDLEDVSKYENLIEGLKSLGLNETEIEQIMFLNAFNFFKSLKYEE